MATAPTITSNGAGATAAISIAENQTAVTTVTATGDAVIAFTITGGADQAKFAIAAGVLTFIVAPNYEVPTDENLDNDYVVAVTATNGTGTDVQTITVTVTNVEGAGDLGITALHDSRYSASGTVRLISDDGLSSIEHRR